VPQKSRPCTCGLQRKRIVIIESSLATKTAVIAVFLCISFTKSYRCVILSLDRKTEREPTFMQIPLGIIGCGTHAKHHAEHYDKHFLTLSVWDPNASAMAEIPSIKKPKTIEELLADERLKAVLISSPDEYHLAQIEMALAAGKHVFCEKPLMVPGEDMLRLEAAFDLAKTKELALTSCHPRRFDRPELWLLDRLSYLENRLGKVLSFAFDFSYHVPSKEWKHGRSLLLDHVNHEVDLMNFLFGIAGFDAWKLHDSFDHYEMVGKRDDGIAFHFQGTRRLTIKKYPEWCRVRFERGEVVLNMMTGTAHVVDHDEMVEEVFTGIGIDYDGRLEGVMGNFASQITRGIPGYLTREEMLMNTEAGIRLQKEGLRRISVRQ